MLAIARTVHQHQSHLCRVVNDTVPTTFLVEAETEEATVFVGVGQSGVDDEVL